MVQKYLTINRNIILSQLEDRYQADIAKYGQMLAVILQMFLSSEAVHVDEYKSYCLKLYLHLATAFTNSAGDLWISIRPTLHKLLAHSWELIFLNDGEGLQRLDESGLEGCNKILRTIRTRQARKISQQACNTDCLSRMWVGSDPILQAQRMAVLPHCKHCQVTGRHGTRYCPIKNPQQRPAEEEDYLVSLLLNTDTNV